MAFKRVKCIMLYKELEFWAQELGMDVGEALTLYYTDYSKLCETIAGINMAWILSVFGANPTLL